jgi:hypothetical protein
MKLSDKGGNSLGIRARDDYIIDIHEDNSELSTGFANKQRGRRLSRGKTQFLKTRAQLRGALGACRKPYSAFLKRQT